MAQKEWRRLATPLHEAGLLTLADRAALAAYCTAYARWVEAEEKLSETPALLKTPSGYPALLLLMAAQILNASFGMQTEHLSMSGDLGLAAIIRSVTTAVFVVVLIVLVPQYSQFGAGIAAVIAAVVFSLSGAVALRLRGGPKPPSPTLAGAALLSTSAMIVSALAPQFWTAALLLLAIGFLVVLVAERALLLRVAASLRLVFERP